MIKSYDKIIATGLVTVEYPSAWDERRHYRVLVDRGDVRKIVERFKNCVVRLTIEEIDKEKESE